MIKLPKNNLTDKLVILLIILYSVIFSFLTILRHNNYYSFRYDLGNMEQVIYNTSKGRIFEFTDPEGNSNISRLKYHADFLLIPLAVIYKIFPYTEFLLIIQSIILGLGALPIYWMAKKILKKNWFALFPVILYLLYPALERSNYFDFHAVKFATTFLLFAFWYLIEKKYFKYIVFSILAVLCKEQIPLIILFMTIYGIIKDQKFRKLGIIFALSNIIYFYIIFFKVIPEFQESSKHFILKHFQNLDTGDNLQNIKVGINFIFNKEVWFLIFQQLFPVMFIPLIAPEILLITFTDILPRLISTNSYYRSIDFQYTNPVIPFIFIAFIFGFKRILNFFNKKKFIQPVLFSSISVCCLVSIIFWSPLSGYFKGVKAIKILRGRPEKNYIDSFKKQVNETDSVCVTDNLGSHFAKRELLFSFPNDALSADYTLVLKGNGNMINSKTTEDTLKLLNSSSQYQKIAEYKDFIAYKRI